MSLKKIAIAFLLPVSMVFAQLAAPADPMGSAPVPASSMPAFQLTEEDLMLIKMLLNNDMFKNSFTEQCTAESANLLGAEQAAKSCKCAYDGLIKNDKLIMLLATTDNDDGFDKWGFDVIAPCLPQKFTAEMEKAFVKQCMAENGESSISVCECTYKTLTSKYTVTSLIKAAFDQGEKLQLDLVAIAGQCASK